MHAALLGATGRTGTLVLDQVVLQGHRVRALVRAEYDNFAHSSRKETSARRCGASWQSAPHDHDA